MGSKGTDGHQPNWMLYLILFVLVLGIGVNEAFAVPPFARRHETSCQTCHIAYPKLNAFGEAYRLNGYRMPGETEAQIKEPDVDLGAEAYKRVWPDAVWPGAIPRNLPLALVVEMMVEDSSVFVEEHVDDGHDDIRLRNGGGGGEGGESDFDFIFPSAVELVAAGTAGDNIAFFGEVGFEQEVEDGQMESEVGVEHVDIRFIRPFRSSLAFNAKVGSLQPELVNTFDHARRLTIANYDSMFGVQVASLGGAAEVGGGHHGGGGSISLPAVAAGFDFYGIVNHRLFWSAGLFNGAGPGASSFDGNSSKDAYARLAYKWGGIDLDGSNADTFAGSAKNWRERSFRLGAFAYLGDGEGVLIPLEAHEEEEGGHGKLGMRPRHLEPPSFIADEEFTRIGVDFNWFIDDFNVFGAFVEGEDELRPFAKGTHGDELNPMDSEDFTYRAWFVEADGVLRFPWLHGAVRYETVDLPGRTEDGHPVDDWKRGVLSLTGLVRANLKTTLEYAWDLDESDNYNIWWNLGIAF